MTIGTILPGILAECGMDRANPDITDSSFEMRQIRALIDAAGKDINQRAEWAKASASFTVLPEPNGTDPTIPVAAADLPDDFQEMAESGAVVLGGYDYRPARPVVEPSLWQLLERFPSAQPYYHLRGGQVLFSPAIGDDGATVRYVSKNWLGTSAEVTSNDDVPVFPDNLLARAVIWRWKRQKGLAYDDLVAEFESELETAIKADRGVA